MYCGYFIPSLDDQTDKLCHSYKIEFTQKLNDLSNSYGNEFGEIMLCLSLFSEILIGTAPTHSIILENSPISHLCRYDLKCKYITRIHDGINIFLMKNSCKVIYSKLHYILKNFVDDYNFEFKNEHESFYTIANDISKINIIKNLRYLLVKLYDELKLLCESIGRLNGIKDDLEQTYLNLYDNCYRVYSFFDKIIHSLSVLRKTPSHINMLVEIVHKPKFPDW